MIKYPRKLLEPLLKYLKKEEKELVKRKSNLESEDPFKDASRLNDNASDDTEAAEQFGHQRTEALGKETEKALKRVQGAMKRVEGGSYGVCMKCKKMINTDRLSIDPTVELCIKCAKKSSK